jgi:hypothetical protein
MLGVGGLDGDFTMSRIQLPATRPSRPPWNKGRLIGQKRPLLPRQVWAIRARLELADNLRDLALFNLAIDSKLRGCDLVGLKVGDLVVGGTVRDRVSVNASGWWTFVKWGAGNNQTVATAQGGIASIHPRTDINGRRVRRAAGALPATVHLERNFIKCAA